MPITLTKKVGKQIPPGSHLAVCFRIVHVGTQPDSGFGCKERLIVTFETPHERSEFDGKEKPLAISKYYNLGASGGMDKKSTLRKDLKAWRGRDFTDEELKGFQLGKILGKGCFIQVEHNEDGKAQATAIMSVPKGMEVPPPFNPLVEYSVNDGKNEVYEKLPDFIKQMCDQCLEWTGKTPEPEPESHEALPVDDGDPTPF